MTVMTEEEAHEFIVKGGEFGELVSKLTARAIDAEALAESLQVTVHLQEAHIASLQKRLANTEVQRDDALRDVGRMNDAETKISAILRESRAQRMAAPPKQEVPVLTGAPMRDPATLKVVRETAIENAARAG